MKSKYWSVPRERLNELASKAQSLHDLLSLLGVKSKSSEARNLVRKIYKHNNICLDHLKTQSQINSERISADSEALVLGWLAGDLSVNPLMKGWQMCLRVPIRKWVINRAGNRCELCGWNEINVYTKTIPLQIHHKDGKAENNRPENLQVLCPNCHSLTENFGRRNKKSSRVLRRAEQVKMA